MSLVELRVELPAYSHSFSVQVSVSATIRDVKQCIQATCTGQPRAEGQRLICRGRALSDDERIEEVWKSSHETRIVHLAVHPTAWTSSPPTIAVASSTSAPPFQPQLSNSSSSTAIRDLLRSTESHLLPPPSTQPAADPLAYVVYMHQTAIEALLQSDRSVPKPSSMSREAAISFVDALGWAWPTILDEPFPRRSPGGVKYTQVVRDGANYLSLEDESQPPTPAQIHAIKVMSHTLAMLKADLPSPTLRAAPLLNTGSTAPLTPQVSAILQQLGIRNLPPGLNVRQDAGNVNLEVPFRNQIPAPDLAPQPQIRPFLIPVTFILLRIGLLLYFFAPARKPFMGMLIIGWALYEIWTRHIRLPNAVGNAQLPDGAGGAPVANAAGAPANANPAAARPLQHGRQRSNGHLDSLATVNMSLEEQAIEGEVTQQPSIIQKAILFTNLFFSTLHPAVWDRRRALLRQREGRIRTEASAMMAHDNGIETPGNQSSAQRREELIARYEGRPQWVREYVQRVVDHDWVEE